MKFIPPRKQIFPLCGVFCKAVIWKKYIVTLKLLSSLKSSVFHFFPLAPFPAVQAFAAWKKGISTERLF